MIWSLLACAVHLGVAPPAHRWVLSGVEAPVAEPGVGDAVRAALLAALTTRGALDPGGEAVAVRVLAADWTVSQRSGTTLLYDARLRVRVETGRRSHEAWAEAAAVDPGSAATVPALRAHIFGGLADEVAADLATWLVNP